MNLWAALATVLTLLPTVAGAQTYGSTLPVEQARLVRPFLELGIVQSEPGEGFHDFLGRVAKVMDRYSARTLHEACGVIMVRNDPEDEVAWRVRITSNRSHVSCTMIQFPMSGWTRLGPDIHSHPFARYGARVNAIDAARGLYQCGYSLNVFDDTFSDVDYKRGAGYLVSRGRLLYQHGKQYPVFQPLIFDRSSAPGEDLPEFIVMLPEGPDETAVGGAWRGTDLESQVQTLCPVDQVDIPVQTADKGGPLMTPANGNRTSPESARHPVPGADQPTLPEGSAHATHPDPTP